MENAFDYAKNLFENRKKLKKEEKDKINLFLKIYNQSSTLKYISIA